MKAAMSRFVPTKLIAIVAIACLPLLASAQEAPEEPPVGDDLVEAILIKEALDIMLANIEASGRESGEIDVLVRALSGVSIKDIKKYGVCGGPNSEVRKLFGSLCTDIK